MASKTSGKQAKPKQIKQLEQFKEPTFIGIKELARRLGISLDSVRRWESTGSLPPSLRIGPKRLRRWDREHIAEWLSAQSQR